MSEEDYFEAELLDKKDSSSIAITGKVLPNILYGHSFPRRPSPSS